MMCSVHPNVPESAIVATAKSQAKTTFWLKFFGWLCVPMCCLGFACIGSAMLTEEIKDKFNKLIDFYGGINHVRMIAVRVRIEANLFRRAVTKVNKEVSPRIIISDINLVTVIKDMVPTFKAVCPRSFDGEHNTNYSKAIWDAYLEMGGNYHAVIYGLVEYMCTISDPTSINVDSYVQLLIKDSSLRAEVLHQRELAGF